jgi:hypothetical protein
VKRNVHNRTKDQIQKLMKTWDRTPANFVKLDIRPILQDEAVQDVSRIKNKTQAMMHI